MPRFSRVRSRPLLRAGALAALALRHGLLVVLDADTARGGLSRPPGAFGLFCAPGSTKNKDEKRDPEMHQTRKGKQYCLGMKLHIGVDSQTGLAHGAVVTAANVHDKHPLPDPLHGQGQQVWGDSAYASQQALIRSKAPGAADRTNLRVRNDSPTEELECLVNRAKSKVRSRVEHVIAVVKRLWSFDEVPHRGLAKNATRSFVTLGLANIYLARRALGAGVRP